jgi:hypothetical protein
MSQPETDAAGVTLYSRMTLQSNHHYQRQWIFPKNYHLRYQGSRYCRLRTLFSTITRGGKQLGKAMRKVGFPRLQCCIFRCPGERQLCIPNIKIKGQCSKKRFREMITAREDLKWIGNSLFKESNDAGCEIMSEALLRYERQ